MYRVGIYLYLYHLSLAYLGHCLISSKTHLCYLRPLQSISQDNTMASHEEKDDRDQESRQLTSSRKESRLIRGLSIARYCQLVLALVVAALGGSMARSIGLHHAHIFILSLLTLVSQIILLVYITVAPLWASKLYTHTAHVLLEIVAIILCIFTFFLLIGQCDAWNDFGDTDLSSNDEAAVMTEMSIQAPPLAILGAATCISGTQTILGAGILITFVIYVRC
ncbi:hypothetical protein BGZ60DRAFT_565376 [Tricladium varicosporioides]|nr:hypothetical protein BGZ60DRAFT_565376 [Hymenoscyphus varicosporioides]